MLYIPLIVAGVSQFSHILPALCGFLFHFGLGQLCSCALVGQRLIVLQMVCVLIAI